tara:strand:+ start:8608 stop:11340 length:2733 start_codon:yes stop_codon:yes gene_type:complete
MTKATYIQTNFTAGEISPRLHSRIDVGKYANGCKTLENMTVNPQGGVVRRGGSKFIAEVKTNTTKVRLISFEFSVTQAYILEFGNQYIRFYKDQGQIHEANKTISGATAANPCVITASSHGYSNGDEVYIDSVVGMTELNGKHYKVADKTTNTFELQDMLSVDVNSSGFTAYSSGGTAARIYTITSPYLEAELFELQFTQSADIMYIAHKNHEPRTLSRTGHTSWTLAEYELLAGPMLTANTTATTLTPSGTSGSVNITASATTGINGGSGFIASDVDRIIQIKQGSTTSHAKINSITSTTVVACTTQTDFADTSSVTSWALGYFYTDNFPQTVAFYEQRLVWAGPPEYPQLMAFSVSGDYTNHLAGTAADDAMVYTIATDQVNAIQWLNSGPVLIAGTAGGEFIVSASSEDEALTPSNVRVVRHTTFGGALVGALRVSNVVLFLQRAKRKIREFVYKFESDTYVAPDLTLLAEHITKTGIVEYDYQQEPDSVLWCVVTDGTLLGMTYQRDQEVIAWHRHILGGASDTASTQAMVESVAIIPATADDGAGIDEVYIAVKRYVNGADRRYVERITTGLELTQTREQAFFIDSGLSLNTPITITATTAADPVVVTASSHGLSNEDSVKIRDIKGMVELNNRSFIVASKGTNSFSLVPDQNAISASITAITKANPAVVTATSHGLTDSEKIYISGVAGMTQVNGLVFTVANKTTNTFELSGIDSSGYGTYTSGGSIRHAEDGTSHTAYISGGNARLETTSITGLDHLEGQVVSILGDGAVQPDKTVASGAITLSTKASIVHVGLPYTSKLVTLNLEAGSADGTAQSKTKRINELTVRLYRSLGMTAGSEGQTLDIVPFRDSSDPMDSSPTLFTGDKRLPYPHGYETSGNIEIQQTQPLPQNIISLITRINTNN